MVSFSCEGCGDVLTKKKLDAHHRQCQGSSFTCLDCMTHFRGTDYRTHTSCVSEEQKYQGVLYKGKAPKSSRKSVKIIETPSRKAYVEDAADPDTGYAISIVDAPPAAPTPPSAVHSQPVQPINVFDFLVTGDTPNASIVSLGGTKESMKMVDDAPSVFSNGHPHGRQAQAQTHDGDGYGDEGEDHDERYEKRGYTYGVDPVPTTKEIKPSTKERPMVEYFTPGPKHIQNGSRESLYDLEDSEKKSTGKRKRGHVEELDLTATLRPSQEPDAIMADATPAILHSGLTGGLGRLLSKHKFPPSPEYSNGDPSPPSPVKRTKTVAKEKERGRKASSSVLVKVRKRRTSDESRPRKHHRSHHSSEHHSHQDHSHHEKPKRKAIEYNAPSHANDSQQQLVVFKSRAELFMSFVTKGPESEQGYSVHKAMKRYHRERGENGLGLEKADEEKELFKGLRLRRNDRGEVVLFF